MIFSKRSKTPPLPVNWPSPLHNKCNQRDCRHPNPPQPVEGTYHCQGIPGGFYCEGTYIVSTARAVEANGYYKEVFRVEEQAKKRAENRRKEEARWARQREEVVRRRYFDGAAHGREDRRDLEKHMYSAAPGRHHSSRHRVPKPLPQAQKELEFRTDKYIQNLYPNRKYPQRWI